MSATSRYWGRWVLCAQPPLRVVTRTRSGHDLSSIIPRSAGWTSLQQCFYSALMDLEDLLSSWEISLRAEHLSRNYVRLCTTSVRTYISAGNSDLDRATVQQFLGGISHPSTANVKGRSLKKFSAWLLTEGEVKDDQLRDLKLPQQQDKMVRKLSEADLVNLLKTCGKDFRGKRDAALILFGLETGARASEVLNLRMDDVDMKRMIAVIRIGKGGRGRFVPFGYQAARALDQYLRARKKHPKASSEWLWIGGEQGEHGGKFSAHLTYNGMTASLRKRAAEAGIENFHFHRLRHSMASNWLKSGGSEGGLMSIAGWRNRKMIQRYTEDTAMDLAIAEARRLQGF